MSFTRGCWSREALPRPPYRLGALLVTAASRVTIPFSYIAGYLLVSYMSTPQSENFIPARRFSKTTPVRRESCARDRIFEAAQASSSTGRHSRRERRRDRRRGRHDQGHVLSRVRFEGRSRRQGARGAESSASGNGGTRSLRRTPAIRARNSTRCSRDVQQRIAGENADRGCLICNAAVEVVEEGPSGARSDSRAQGGARRALARLGRDDRRASARRARRRADVAR